jgi:ABC-type amino acid transport substrate-binding protein
LQTFCDNKSHYHWSDTELKATFDKALVVMRAEGTYNELAKNILILMFMANNTEC